MHNRPNREDWKELEKGRGSQVVLGCFLTICVSLPKVKLSFFTECSNILIQDKTPLYVKGPQLVS